MGIKLGPIGKKSIVYLLRRTIARFKTEDNDLRYERLHT
jgi:hypothetical protein